MILRRHHYDITTVLVIYIMYNIVPRALPCIPIRRVSKRLTETTKVPNIFFSQLPAGTGAYVRNIVGREGTESFVSSGQPVLLLLVVVVVVVVVVDGGGGEWVSE